MMHVQYFGLLKLLIFFFTTKMSSSYEHPNAVAELATAQNLFTRDLYQSLITGSNENVFFSPFSIMTAIAMTHMGAQANTEKQIQQAFYFPENKQTVKEALSDILFILKNDSKDYQLNIANSAYISDRLNVLEEYVNTLVNAFHSKTESANYDAPEVVRKQINDFVEKATRSKITELIPSGVLKPLTRMVLVNAVYFKGLWQHQFDPELTTVQPFWLNTVDKINTPMMTNKKMYKYGINRELSATLISLDYKGNEISMIVVLPRDRNGLAELEAKLADIDFATLDKKLHKTEVTVEMPKFKLQNEFELSKTLQKLGVTDLFVDGIADLSGISGDKSLFVSNVIHKSFIEVNEEGSEAAAATGVVIATRSMVGRPTTFVADHPFFFFIKHNPSGQILFTGRLLKPMASDVCETDSCSPLA